MLPCKLNWNNISLRRFLEFLQTVNCTELERSQNTIYIRFRINPNRWNAKISFEKYTPKIRQKYFPKCDNKFHKLCQVLHLFPIYFTILANFQTMICIKNKKITNVIKKNKTNGHRKTNTKNIEHNTLYTPNK